MRRALTLMITSSALGLSALGLSALGLSALGLSALGLSACASRPPVLKTPEPLIEMEPLLIRGGSEEALSAESLFEEGVGALQAEEFARCVDRLELYLTHFPKHSARQYARYNLGLCLELSGRYQEAADVLGAYVEEARRSAEKQDRLDGEVRLGFNLVNASRAEEAIALYDTLLTTEPLIGFDRAECHLRRAIAHRQLKRFAEAERDLSLSLSHLNGAIGQRREGNELLAELHFHRGELYRLHMREVKLKMPLERMKRLFADKVLFFRKSLYAYVDAINVHHVYWGVAAGHQLGRLHEQLYTEFMQAEAPPDFDEETLAYYFFELEKKLAPLLRESIGIYEKTMTLSVTHGIDNGWVKGTQESLDRLRALDEAVQRRLTLDPLEAHQARPSPQAPAGPPLEGRGEPQEDTHKSAQDEVSSPVETSLKESVSPSELSL